MSVNAFNEVQSIVWRLSFNLPFSFRKHQKKRIYVRGALLNGAPNTFGLCNFPQMFPIDPSLVWLVNEIWIRQRHATFIMHISVKARL